jgi:hypothetical protein
VKRHTLGILSIAAVIAACAGGSQNIVGPELFTYSATSQVTSTNPMRFQTTLTVTNPLAEEITFTAPPCNALRVLVYTTAARTGMPVFDTNSRPNICTLPGTSTKLAPGKSVSYSATVLVSEVLGESGSAGTYYVTDEVSLSGVVSRKTAGEVNVTR